MAWDTAQEMAAAAQKQTGIPLALSPDDMSARAGRVAPGVKVHDVAVPTLRQVPGVTPIERSRMFQAYRHQFEHPAAGYDAAVSPGGGLFLAIIALVFTAVANEQRQQIHVLRALGATRGFVLRTLLAAAGMLALTGAFLGSVLAVSAVYLLRDMLIRTVGVPYLAPSSGVMLPMLLGSLLLALAMVSLAAFGAGLPRQLRRAGDRRGNQTATGIWYDSAEEVMPCHA